MLNAGQRSGPLYRPDVVMADEGDGHSGAVSVQTVLLKHKSMASATSQDKFVMPARRFGVSSATTSVCSDSAQLPEMEAPTGIFIVFLIKNYLP